MRKQNEVDPNFPPPGDEEVQPSWPQHSEEFGLAPLGDPMGLYESQPILEATPGGGGERKEASAAEAAEGPQAFHPTITLTIEGIEATQATQFYQSSRHLHAPHSEPDNSVPLIERKHLAIRVYPDLQMFSFNQGHRVVRRLTNRCTGAGSRSGFSTSFPSFNVFGFSTFTGVGPPAR